MRRIVDHIGRWVPALALSATGLVGCGGVAAPEPAVNWSETVLETRMVVSPRTPSNTLHDLTHQLGHVNPRTCSLPASVRRSSNGPIRVSETNDSALHMTAIRLHLSVADNGLDNMSLVVPAVGWTACSEPDGVSAPLDPGTEVKEM